MKRLWIVEARLKNGEWIPCSWPDVRMGSNNYYEAHKYKRESYNHLHKFYPAYWRKKHFRVREYRRVK